MRIAFRSRHSSICLLGVVVIASCGGGAAAPGLGADGGAGRITVGTAGHGGNVGSPGAGGGVGPGACQAAATDCTENTRCCSGRCEPVTGQAGVIQCTNACFADGVACTKALDCCALGCFGGRCGGGLCKVESESCTANADCCSGVCHGGQCKVTNGAVVAGPPPSPLPARQVKVVNGQVVLL